MYAQQVMNDIREVGCWDEALGHIWDVKTTTWNFLYIYVYAKK